MKKIKIITVGIFSLILVACQEEIIPPLGVKGYDIVCIESIEYITGWRSMSPHINKDTLLPTICTKK